MDCPICKSENDPKNKFCIVCGTNIKNVDFVNNIDVKSEATNANSKSIRIINTIIHGGISFEGTAYGRDEGFHLNSKRHSPICPNCGNIVELNHKDVSRMSSYSEVNKSCPHPQLLRQSPRIMGNC
jgi:endogenous inhibitor of DNA gyrase (YacG/DUF329 family)